MKTRLKYIILLTMFLVGIMLIITNIIEQEYATIETQEDNHQPNKEVIENNKEPLPKEYPNKFTIDALNMREGPSVDYAVMLEIPIGEEVMIVGQEEGWDKVTYEDRTGYSNAKYLTDSKEVAEAAVIKNNKFNTYLRSKEQKEVIETMKISQGILLVNKVFDLPKDYNPGEDSEAVTQLHKMIQGAKEETGRKIMSVSGYRSYDYQEGLYNRNVRKDGEAIASTYSAKPGQSEHQTGLAFDIGGVDKHHWVEESFGETMEGQWLMENAHKYGFILRYPKEKTDITGYKYEPWHYRYIGKEHASMVYEENLTLEEYLLK